MRRLLLSGILAIGLHSLLFETEFSWLKTQSHPQPKHRPITVSLTYRKPYMPETKKLLQKQKIKLKKALSLPPKIKIKPIIPIKVVQPVPELKQLGKFNTVSLQRSIRKTEAIVEHRKIKPIRAPLISKTPGSLNKLIPPAATHKIDMISTPLILKKQRVRNIFTPPIAEAVKKARPETAQTAGVILRQAKPLFRVNSPPEYPRIARKRGYQGIVILDVQVTRNGKVGNLKVHKSSGYPVLDRSATASVNNWIFEPGIKAGKPVDMWVRVPVRFKLE